MATAITLSTSGNYKYTMAKHRSWQCACIGNGESRTRVVGSQIASSTDVYTLGIIPTFVLTAPTDTAGTSTVGTYGVCLVYRSTKFSDSYTTDDIQGNRSNIVDVTLAANKYAVLTKVTTTDTKIDKLDVYVAQKIGSTYGTFYRCVKDAANTAGTITFDVIYSAILGVVTSTAVTNGTADAAAKVLADDNDFPSSQPILLEAAGRLISLGGNVVAITATFTNSNGTVTLTTGNVYDGVEFWYLKRTSDTTGGIDGRGTYLCRYASSTTLSIVAADGTASTYTGTTGIGVAGQTWTAPNRGYSKFLNPHATPSENITNDYSGALLAGGKVPNTNRVLVMGADFVVAEDYDHLPIDGLNTISSEYGCGSHPSIVAAHGRLYWLDFCKGKREIIMSDGSSCVPISTAKIKSILQRVTQDANGDAWRVSFLAGAYYRASDTIRWGLYLDGNTVACYSLELDLNTGDVRGDPQFYGHRYLDLFTYGVIRGKNYIGQYGTGVVARLGLDDVDQRYIDWVPSGTVSGVLDTTLNTTTVLTVNGASFYTTGNGLVGVQVMLWQESTAGTAATLIAAPIYYYCRISANTGTTFTVNYVETMNAVGSVTSVGTVLPSAPNATGWNFRIGVIQSIIGPKFFAAQDSTPAMTFNELSMIHQGQNLSTNPITVHSYANLDQVPVDAQYAEPTAEGPQPSSLTSSAASLVRPKTAPSGSLGFQIVDNNADFGTTALSVETITLNYNDHQDQGDGN